MRPTVVALTPAFSAILRVLQCVRPLGFVSSVCTTIASTASSEMVIGAPGLGSSNRPSTPDSMKRLRHFPTVTWDVRSFAAIARFVRP